ncbi:alpha-L-fucosidase [Anditalea andensis]
MIQDFHFQLPNVSKVVLMASMLFTLSCQEAIVAPEAETPVPSQRQLIWQEMEFYGFVHFSINTFTDMEWGLGDESPDRFNPTELDTRQWVREMADAGMRGVIITAKHHDGFCLWPSRYTEHSVKNSPWKNGEGDVIRELADACEEYGLKLGVYYSPWDRHHADYGKPEYITYMRLQLEELLTNYGDIFEVWFDGANGGTGYYGGANEERRVDKKSYYDWENTFALVRKLQPDAVIFGDAGPDVRWVGNEEGHAYPTTWSNLLRDSVYAGMPEYGDKYAKGQENGTHWVPAEADVSIRPGWYYHAYEDHKVKSLSQLMDIYYKSIGRNSSLLLNFPVDKRGLIHENDVMALRKMASKIKEDFAVDLIAGKSATASTDRGAGYQAGNVLDGQGGNYWAAPADSRQGSIEVDFDGELTFNRLWIQEYIPLGQRVKKFTVEVKQDGQWTEIAAETTIGFKRLLRLEDTKGTSLRLNILDAKSSPLISSLRMFHAPKMMEAPVISRDVQGMVSINSPEEGLVIFYTSDGTTPGQNSQRYMAPFQPEYPALIKAITFDEVQGRSSDAGSQYFDMPKGDWKVLEAGTEGNKAIDENINTHYSSQDDRLTLDLGQALQLMGFTYTPMQQRYLSGVIKEYRFYTSRDSINWELVAEGEFGNIENSPILQRITLDRKVNARYIRLESKRTTDGKNASFAEVGVITE